MSQTELNIVLFFVLLPGSFVFKNDKYEPEKEDIIFTQMCGLIFIKIFMKCKISLNGFALYGKRNYYQFNKHADACRHNGRREFSRLLC